MRALVLKVAVELMFDNFRDICLVLSENTLFWMQASFLAVKFLFIKDSFCPVVPIVA